MKSFLVMALVASFSMATLSPAFAIKQLNDQFKKHYLEEKEDVNEDFKALVEEAKCNVCHVYRENKKNVRNPYGTALQEAIKKDEFPVAEFKKEPEKYAERLNDLFKKIAKLESKDKEKRTFEKRMEDGLLPGGDVEGKME